MQAQDHANWNESSFTKPDVLMKRRAAAAGVWHQLRKALMPWRHSSPGRGEHILCPCPHVIHMIELAEVPRASCNPLAQGQVGYPEKETEPRLFNF